MIHSEADFEATLDEVANLLDHPFGPEAKERLGGLLLELQAYRPIVVAAAEPENKLAEQGRKLRQHVAAFEERVGGRHPSVMGDLAVALGLYPETDLHAND